MKRLGIIVLIVVGLSLAIVVMTLLQRVDPRQHEPTTESYEFADTLAGGIYDLDSLKTIIGANKGLPEGFETAAAIAYSAYPELRDVNIDMVLTDDGAPMESTVDLWSLIDARGNRRYRVLLNNAEHTFFDPILLRSLPFDAQVGILAHELGHITYYHQLNVFQFGKWGLEYLQDDDFRAAHERTTDLMPVYHGLGSQIYQYAYFVRKDPSCKSFYEREKDFMDRFYLTDEALLEAMTTPDFKKSR